MIFQVEMNLMDIKKGSMEDNNKADHIGYTVEKAMDNMTESEAIRKVVEQWRD